MDTYEVDFLAVGDGDRSGDAITLRYGNLYGSRAEHVVAIVDGGTKETGRQLVEHVRTYFDPAGRVDFAVSTHPDADHASGLSVVLEELNVRTLLMHRPWEHASSIRDLFKDGRLTVAGLEQKLEKALQSARDLETIAARKGITIVEPFAGSKTDDGSFHFLGPDLGFYESLLPYFRRTPSPSTPISFLGMLEVVKKGAQGAIEWVAESFDVETLDDIDDTSAENNSSAILLLTVGEQRILLSGDAGITALSRALDYAATLGIDLLNVDLFHVPHHGSKHNLGPTVLNRLRSRVSVVSAAAQGAPKHPSKKVTNALIRRGGSVFVTRGSGIVYPNTRGWHAAPPEPFHHRVEK